MGDLIPAAEDPRSRLSRLLNTEGFIDTLCENIACGETLVGMADNLDVNYGKLAMWVNADTARTLKYTAALNARAEWGEDIVIRELKRIAMADVRWLYNEHGGLKDPHDWPTEAARSVAGIKTKELFDNEGNKIGEMKEVKLWDKMKALELMGKNLKMFTEKREISGSVSLEQLVSGK